MTFAAWVALAAAADGRCEFQVDGQPAVTLDCAKGGAWTVVCPLPEGRAGKVRVTLDLPTRDLHGEARVPLSHLATITVPLAGPGGRAGGFIVDRAAGGLLPGQAIGPNQLCPSVQPGVAPGVRAEVDLQITARVHQQTGFAEEVLAGGVTSRVPVYDAGVLFSDATIPVVQREVVGVPVLDAPTAGPRNEIHRGQLALTDPAGTWRAVGFSAWLRDVPVGDSGEVVALAVDFVAPELEVAVGGDPSVWLERELAAWLAGDASSLLGPAAFVRSGLEPPVSVIFADVGGDRRATAERIDARVLRQGDRLRASVIWRAAPFDAAARAVVEEAAAAAMGG